MKHFSNRLYRLQLLLLAGALTASTAHAYPHTFAPVVTYVAAPSSSAPGYLSTKCIAVADINGNTYPDLLTANTGGGSVNSSVDVLPGNSMGTFPAAATTYSTGSNVPYSIAVADVNNDQKPDLLTSNGLDLAGVLLNTTVFAAPTLTNLSPTSAAVGTSITLTGTGLAGATAISFNGTAATTFAVASATSATATVPAGATSGPVTITTPSGTSNGVAFSVTPSATAAPVLSIALPSTTAPPLTYRATPTYTGTAAGGSTVRVYVDGALLPTTATTTQGGTFSLVQPTPLANGPHTVYATAQASGATVSANSNTITFTVDATPPTVRIVSPGGGTTGNSPVIFHITFLEAVNYNQADITNNLTNFSSFFLDGSSAPFYVLTVIPAANGPVTLSIPANTTTDLVGNSNTAAQPVSIQYTGAPILNTPANGSVTNNNQLTFSGTVSPASSAVDLFLDNSFVIGALVSTGGTFMTSRPFGPLADGVHSVYANGTRNNSFSGKSNTNTFTVDTTPPTVAISSPAVAAGGTTSTTPVPVTVTFSESVTGFLPSDVVLTNGTLTGGVVSGSGATYTFGVTPTGAGAVTINVVANAAQDAATNGSTAAPAFGFTYAVAPATTLTTWTGAVSTDWFAAGNWSAGVPTATLDAVVPGGLGRYPAVATGAAATRALTLASGATLTQAGGTLSVSGNLTNNGLFATTNAAGTAGGTVTMGLASGTNILGSSPIRFWNFTVAGNSVALGTAAGASVRQVLTLSADLAMQGNRLTLESASTGDALVVNSGGAVLGATAVVQRYIDPSLNPGAGYHHYAPPVSGSTVADLATSGFTPVLNSAYNTSATPAAVMPFPTVFGYDQALVNRVNASPNFDKGFFSPATLATPLTPSFGYAVNIGASELVDFVGTLNTGDFSASVSRNASGTLNSADAGWALLGNPYPAPLDLSKVADGDRANLGAGMYVYQSTGQYVGQYRTYANGLGGNSVLPVGQGFFVRVATGQASGSFTFRNSQRLVAPTATTFQRPTADLRPQVQLELRGSTGPADAFIAYAEAGATPALDDHYDAAKLPNPTGLNLAGLASSGESLAIDGRPAFGAATTLPLAVGVPTAGTYSLAAAVLANLPAGLRAYLTDAQTGQTVGLAPGTSYTFSVTAAEATALLMGRFTLLFRPITALATTPSLTAELVSVYPNPAHARFVVALPGVAQATTVQAELLNALGQVVSRQSAALPGTGTQLTFETADLATGIYTLRLQAGATTLAKRVVLH